MSSEALKSVYRYASSSSVRGIMRIFGCLEILGLICILWR